MVSYSNSYAWLTGASKGLGAAYAEELAQGRYAKAPNSSWSDPSSAWAMHKLPFADPDHVIESTVTS
jgi:NAD(P)-dependent dehydrogenase (short-subunit alcohol dehydrogenase family)